ncbi:MAG: deoxyuridine 5'-triphosphate nucleotidohydrolase, partial [Thalassobium sp.]
MPLIAIEWVDGADQSLPLPAYQTQGAAGADVCANLPDRG